jgi:hypothetical protein
MSEWRSGCYLLRNRKGVGGFTIFRRVAREWWFEFALLLPHWLGQMLLKSILDEGERMSALYKMKWNERENNNIENITSDHGVVLFVRSSLYAL